jgi:hypothetical protein
MIVAAAPHRNGGHLIDNNLGSCFCSRHLSHQREIGMKALFAKIVQSQQQRGEL